MSESSGAGTVNILDHLSSHPVVDGTMDTNISRLIFE